jgi:hypothetical protein
VIVLSSGSESDTEEEGERVERTLFVGQGKGKAKAKGKAQAKAPAKAKAKAKGKASVQLNNEEMADRSEGERAGDNFYELTPQLPPHDNNMDNDDDDNPTGAEATQDEKEEEELDEGDPATDDEAFNCDLKRVIFMARYRGWSGKDALPCLQTSRENSRNLSLAGLFEWARSVVNK